MVQGLSGTVRTTMERTGKQRGNRSLSQSDRCAADDDAFIAVRRVRGAQEPTDGRTTIPASPGDVRQRDAHRDDPLCECGEELAGAERLGALPTAVVDIKVAGDQRTSDVDTVPSSFVWRHTPDAGDDWTNERRNIPGSRVGVMGAKPSEQVRAQRPKRVKQHRGIGIAEHSDNVVVPMPSVVQEAIGDRRNALYKVVGHEFTVSEGQHGRHGSHVQRMVHEPPARGVNRRDPVTSVAGRWFWGAAGVLDWAVRSGSGRRTVMLSAAVLAVAVGVGRTPLALEQEMSADAAPVAALPSAQASTPAPSVSRYVNWLGGDRAVDSERSAGSGCATATAGPGPVVLHLGRQAGDGTTAFRTTRSFSYDYLTEQMVEFARGLRACAPGGTFWLLPSTSNHHLDTAVDPYMFGSHWQRFVTHVAAQVDADASDSDVTIHVYGGIDLEPAWSSPEAAMAWAAGYQTGDTPLWSGPSADGCPRTAGTSRCANGWDIEQLAQFVWARQTWAPIPQVYRTDGAQAQQWAMIAQRWQRSGNTPVFAGVMTQQRACTQVADPNCQQLSLGPLEAQQMLADYSGLEVPVATDIGWG